MASISGTTIWRWLSEDAIRPWSRRSGIFPRDPDFGPKAERVLDLYRRTWEGQSLGAEEFVICADEKTQLQLRERIHPPTPPAPGRPQRVEHEYRRHGTCAYQAARDVHHACLFGHVVERSTIVNFDRLVARVMAQQPYTSAERVFWIVDNAGIHRGRTSIARLEGRWPNLRLIHLPVHASWLNQIEICFSIFARKAWTPGPLRLLRGRRGPRPRLPGPLPGDRPALPVNAHASRSDPPAHAPRCVRGRPCRLTYVCELSRTTTSAPPAEGGPLPAAGRRLQPRESSHCPIP